VKLLDLKKAYVNAEWPLVQRRGGQISDCTLGNFRPWLIMRDVRGNLDFRDWTDDDDLAQLDEEMEGHDLLSLAEAAPLLRGDEVLRVFVYDPRNREDLVDIEHKDLRQLLPLHDEAIIQAARRVPDSYSAPVLFIQEPDALAKLAKIEGRAWANAQRRGGVKLPYSFFLNLAACQIAKEQGLDVDLEELDPEAGYIKSASGQRYYRVGTDGEIMFELHQDDDPPEDEWLESEMLARDLMRVF
jgi:hypothetical protein